MERGMFITFEGGEGSGKTTLCEKTAEYLAKKGRRVLKAHEPGGTKLGEEIKKLLLGDEGLDLDPKAELFLFLASRAQLVEETLRPALCEGKFVLCDRYIDSTVAYQAFGRGIDENTARDMNKFAVGGLEPDLTFVLDIETPLGLKRARERGKIQGREGDRIEKAVLGFHQRVRQGYLSLARAEPSRIKMLDGSDDIKKIERSVKRHIENFISKLKQEQPAPGRPGGA